MGNVIPSRVEGQGTGDGGRGTGDGAIKKIANRLLSRMCGIYCKLLRKVPHLREALRLWRIGCLLQIDGQS
jgi:hypothetical protein